MPSVFSESFIIEAAEESLNFLKHHKGWDERSEHFARIQAFLFLVREDIAEFSLETQGTIADIAREAARLDAIRVGRTPTENDLTLMLENWKFETAIAAFQQGTESDDERLDHHLSDTLH